MNTTTLLDTVPVIIIKAKDLRGVKFQVYARHGRYEITRKGPQGEVLRAFKQSMDKAVETAAAMAGVPKPMF